jgi:23S rRNA pseudouridine1911/1915/1917 synthase
MGRHARHRKKMAVTASGKPARTRWRVVAHYRDTKRRPYTLLEVDLLTGRTHQIRVHFSWLGYPLVGDTVYSSSNALAAPRKFLHARDLRVIHPVTEEVMTFSAPLPVDLNAILALLDREEISKS